MLPGASTSSSDWNMRFAVLTVAAVTIGAEIPALAGQIPFSALRTDGDIDTFLEVIDWAIGVIEADDE